MGTFVTNVNTAVVVYVNLTVSTYVLKVRNIYVFTGINNKHLSFVTIIVSYRASLRNIIIIIVIIIFICIIIILIIVNPHRYNYLYAEICALRTVSV